MLAGKRILVIIGGGIAAYKVLELIRRLRGQGAQVSPVLTAAGAQFVTPLSVSALAGEAVHEALFDLTAESQMGHIQLSRAADLVVVAPATADFMAKMAGGQADDLASTLVLATNKPVLAVPAMNVQMWHHPATQRNLAQLRRDGILFCGPTEGDMACGEYGPGRMAEVADILAAITGHFTGGPLKGRHILVTSGPTHEPIDPVRYIANRSSGAQGTALAGALRDLGARVSFITGPAQVPPPDGVAVIRVETARQMYEAVLAALPADAAIFAAAVADWGAAQVAGQKMKKQPGQQEMALNLVKNPDILAHVAGLKENRPALVVGFAAETERVVDHATRKRAQKQCDWIVANDVSPTSGIMGGHENAVTLIDGQGAQEWPRMSKAETARLLADHIARALNSRSFQPPAVR